MYAERGGEIGFLLLWPAVMITMDQVVFMLLGKVNTFSWIFSKSDNKKSEFELKSRWEIWGSHGDDWSTVFWDVMPSVLVEMEMILFLFFFPYKKYQDMSTYLIIPHKNTESDDVFWQSRIGFWLKYSSSLNTLCFCKSLNFAVTAFTHKWYSLWITQGHEPNTLHPGMCSCCWLHLPCVYTSVFLCEESRSRDFSVTM